MLNISRLDLNDAVTILKGAKIRSEAINVPMCIAVTDESGNLIAFERMNGSKIHSIILAQDKAFTAGAARKATHDYNAANKPGSLSFGIDTECGGRISTVGGGVPVNVDGEFVGGVGVSSGAPEEDMDVAQAGIDYFLINR